MDLSLSLYQKLYLIRSVEQYIVKHYPENEMKCPMHMSMGQEAISVGVCHALKTKDQVFGTYRSHAAFLAKTADIDSFFGEIYGRITGTAQGKSGSMHVAIPEKGYMGSSGIVGTCIPLAVGTAFANKYKKNGQIVCVFFGDGALDTGVFWESLNVAGLMKLPVLFVVEDNGYAVNTPVCARQSFKDITDIASKFECNTWKANTSDVEDIYKIARDAVKTIEITGKPSLLHLKCYRYLEHVGIGTDFNNGRSKEEFEEWYKRDCITLQRNRLLNTCYTEGDIRYVEDAIEYEIEKSAKRARDAPQPEVSDIYRGVFYDN